MKIGFYSPYLNSFGGGERYMLTLASHLSQNHVVDIFWDEKTIKPILARFLKIDLSKTNFKPNFFKENFINKVYKSFQYDSIFILSDGSVPFIMSRNNIIHFQVPFNKNFKSFKTSIKLKRYKHVTVNSNFTKGYIDNSFGVNSRVIYPPVDIADIKKTEKDKIILAVGRFSKTDLHNKKQEILIEVFRELSKSLPGWKLVLVGQSKKSDEKQIKFLKKISKGFAIRILENISREKLCELYARSTIFWHAAGFGEDSIKNPQKTEHFGISTVEASAAGAAPVVYKAGGQKEIIEDDVNGIFWVTKAQLLEKTKEIISDSKKLHKLSENAIKNGKKFSKEKFLAQYEEIIL